MGWQALLPCLDQSRHQVRRVFPSWPNFPGPGRANWASHSWSVGSVVDVRWEIWILGLFSNSQLPHCKSTLFPSCAQDCSLDQQCINHQESKQSEFQRHSSAIAAISIMAPTHGVLMVFPAALPLFNPESPTRSTGALQIAACLAVVGISWLASISLPVKKRCFSCRIVGTMCNYGTIISA